MLLFTFSEMKVNNVQEFQKMLIKAYTEKDRQLERTEQDLRETRMDLYRVKDTLGQCK